MKSLITVLVIVPRGYIFDFIYITNFEIRFSFFVNLLDSSFKIDRIMPKFGKLTYHRVVKLPYKSIGNKEGKS